MECSPTCPCCQRHNQRTESLHRHALDEINFYRRLLQMSQLSRIDAFSEFQSGEQLSLTASSSSTLQSVTATIPAARTLESMPPEILDRIAAHVDGDAIWLLARAIPYFKYISTAMFEVIRTAKPNLPRRQISRFFWPEFRWDFIRGGASFTFPLAHLHAVGTYSRILSKHGGHARFHAYEDMNIMLGAMPEKLSFSLERDGGWPQFAALLTKISGTGRSIYTLYYIHERRDGNAPCPDEIGNQLATMSINRISAQTPMPPDIQRIVHRIPNLSVLELLNPDNCTGIMLSQCRDLNEVRFLEPFKTKAQVDRFMGALKESSVRKVGVVLGFQGEGISLKSLSRMFLARGWHKQHESFLQASFVLVGQ
ncbi:hypothetical protein HDU77_000866 [Chytriomyces hyalinus]|nr:hypothetical protein HDU77_000866 [Chytriomyces hyalinus]